MRIQISSARPDSLHASQLIEELEATLAPLYPAESRHGYNVEQLLKASVAFFIAHVDDNPAGCGGVQLYDLAYAEIKRLYVRPQYRGLGLAKRLLQHLVNVSEQRGIRVLRLETGIHQTDAISLYEHLGFQRIPPFGTYQEDPLSVFFEKRL